MENKISAKNGAIVVEKKPKDLLRAIGRIESNDWNIREIEKKIELSKKTEVGKSREKVPKWSKEQFLQRQHKMARPQDALAAGDERFRDIDQTIRNLDKQLRDGSHLERGQRGKNKVASIASGTFGNTRTDEQTDAAEPIGVQKTVCFVVHVFRHVPLPLFNILQNSKKNLVFNAPTGTDVCHFCKQKVYLMEKISVEGLLLHRACLKCHHCHTSLRLGGYAFDRDDVSGRFYCTQHYRLPAKVQRPIPRRSMPRHAGASMITAKSPDTVTDSMTAACSPHDTRVRLPETPERLAARARREGIARLDLLNRGYYILLSKCILDMLFVRY